jgi:mannose-1-phosphate guanylyltransferase
MTLAQESVSRRSEKPLGKRLLVEPWTVILAGGEGRRLSQLIRSPHTKVRPEQAPTLINSRSMLRHTYDAALRLSQSGKILVVIPEGQQRWALAQLPKASRKNFAVLPHSLGTGPAIFLALAHIVGKDSCAPVILMPTDHFAYPDEVFGANFARLIPRFNEMAAFSAVLFGIKASGPHKGLKWILPGKPFGTGSPPRLFKVAKFIENPRRDFAEKLYEGGALLNTSILAGRARSLWHLLSKRMPETASCVLNRFRQFARCGLQRRMDEASRLMMPFNFSSQVLEREMGELAVAPLEDVHGEKGKRMKARKKG